MTEKILFEFNGFSLDCLTGAFIRDGNPTQLRAKPFELLLVFVQNAGQSLSKEELIKLVWSGATVTDANFHVHLDAVRKALGETGRQPHFILRTSGGYKFVGQVRKVTIQVAEQEVKKPPVAAYEPKKHLAHILTASGMYAALYSAAVFLEVAYKYHQFDHTAMRLAPVVFIGILATSVGALALDHRLTLGDRSAGLLVSILVFISSAGALLGALSFFLPSYAITESVLQTYPAQAAYLKDESYFLILAIFFLIIPFHFITAMGREIEKGNHREVLGLLTGNKSSPAPKGVIYPRLWALAGLLLVFLIMSLVMTARLLDNLKPSPYQNLFVQLVYLRALLYFGLGIECLIWYYRALEELKSQTQ